MLLKRINSDAFHVFRLLGKKPWVFGETISACTSNFNSSCPKQRFWKTPFFWVRLTFWHFQEFERWFLDFGRKFSAESFSRNFLAGISRLQLLFLREPFQIVLQVFSIIFLSGNPFDFWQNFHNRFAETSIFLILRSFLRWLTSKTMNLFQKFRILINFFHVSDEHFPAALCKLHSKCPEEQLERFFLSENTRNILSIPNFW